MCILLLNLLQRKPFGSQWPNCPRAETVLRQLCSKLLLARIWGVISLCKYYFGLMMWYNFLSNGILSPNIMPTSRSNGSANVRHRRMVYVSEQDKLKCQVFAYHWVVFITQKHVIYLGLTRSKCRWGMEIRNSPIPTVSHYNKSGIWHGPIITAQWVQPLR